MPAGCCSGGVCITLALLRDRTLDFLLCLKSCCFKRNFLLYHYLFNECFLFVGRTLPGGWGMVTLAVGAKCRLRTGIFMGIVAAPSTDWLVPFPALCTWVSKPIAGEALKWLWNKKCHFTFQVTADDNRLGQGWSGEGEKECVCRDLDPSPLSHAPLHLRDPLTP